MEQEHQNQFEALLRLFKEHDLDELLIEEGDFKIHLRRSPSEAKPALTPIPAKTFRGVYTERSRRAQDDRVVTRADQELAIRSPLVGIFYRTPSPDTPPFVEIGDLVAEGQTIGVVEAMKVFNEIKAEWSGRVVAIPARSGDLVQAGDPLVILELISEHSAN